MLGLDWQYEAIEVDVAGLAGFIGTRGPDWRGLSLTMPLKHDVLPLLTVVDDLVELTGVANTVLFSHRAKAATLHGFNTDVFGIVTAFQDAGVDHLTSVRILGAGATAASALVAVARLGARRAVVSARSAHALGALFLIGERLGIDVQAAPPVGVDDEAVHDAVVSTLPGGADHRYHFDSATRASAALFDVAYDPWPSPLAASWLDAGGRVIPGIDMLVNQALLQVRIFVGGEPDRILPHESAVLAAMRESVGL